MTFADLSLASRALASRLGEAGVRAGMRVAISLPQSPLNPVAHLACSRVGAITVPLAPVLGPSALSPRLAVAAPALAIVDASRLDAFREAGPGLALWVAQGRNLRTTRGAVTMSAAAAAPLAPGAERAMSLFFTSGTSAAPKPVLLPHRVIDGRLEGFRRAHPGVGEDDAFWSPAEWSWIGGLHDALFAPWATGARVVSAQRAGHFDPSAAHDLLVASGVTRAFLPPTALKTWRRSGAPVPKLRSLHTAGEPLPPTVLSWAEASFGTKVREVYGMTECAFVLVNDEGAPGVTGRAASGAQVEVRDGEVRIREGAPTMMLGYVEGGRLVRPTPDGWLRTGDAGRATPEGITVLGRLDDVIKTSGHRVSPGEVEAVLLADEGVVECAVVGIPDEARGHVIHAFVRASPGRVADAAFAAALQERVRTEAAPHMVPRVVTFVDELPTTVNGKVLRRALRERSTDPSRAP